MCREDSLKQEVKDMESRCLRAEQRHADLVAAMPSATQPLLRQLEALQVWLEASGGTTTTHVTS